jgi:hypothetical protein
MTAVASEGTPIRHHRLRQLLRAAVQDLARARHQVWGVEQFTGRDPAGDAVEVAVYGRDASDARRLTRYCGPCCGCATLTSPTGPSAATALSSRIRASASATSAAHPPQLRTRKIVYVLAGSTLAQRVIVLALGASLHAVGQHASLATLITVNTLAAIIGGAVPVPGGAGVIEAGLAAGLTSAGIPRTRPSRRCSSSGCSPPTCPWSGASPP